MSPDAFPEDLAEALVEPAPARPALPEPVRERWQPLRIGLVELFHYDSEEFWFRDGHLLLRGNNGTGKSKVLSLTLPFLFDAQLRSSRVEPDGDAGKKMAWNLLMNAHPRRVGYTWIELGRVGDDGEPRYLTLGAGLSAVLGRAQVESWFFVLDDDVRDAQGERASMRIGRDLWLVDAQRHVLVREKLREAIEGRGQLYDSASSYRRAVDERLFHLGTRRYEALMDTLIQLRQPQLSRKPDEAGLSHALTEALPPMPQELLTDVAEALNRLEEDRRQLDEIKELAHAVKRFDQRYRLYAGMLTRRQARELRQAQTEFDRASQERNRAQAELQAAQQVETQARNAHENAERTLAAQRSRLETLQSSPTMQDANRLDGAEKDAARRRAAVHDEVRACETARERLQREEQAATQCETQVHDAGQALFEARSACADDSDVAGLAALVERNPLAALPVDALADLAARDVDTAAAALRAAAADRREQIALLRRRHEALRGAVAALTLRQDAQRERQSEFDESVERRNAADAAAEQAAQEHVDDWHAHCAQLVELRFASDEPLRALDDWVLRAEGENPAQLALAIAQREASERHASRRQEIATRDEAIRRERNELEAERERLQQGRDNAPPVPYTRDAASRAEAPGAPLWQLVDFHEHVDENRRAGLEAALEASGLLDAWVGADGVRLGEEGAAPWFDTQWLRRPRANGDTLADWLCVSLPIDSPVPAGIVETLLAGVACSSTDVETGEAWISPDGRFRLGTLAGAWAKPQAAYIGHAARAQARRRRLDEIAQRLGLLEAEAAQLAGLGARLEADRARAEHEWRGAPSAQPLRETLLQAAARARETQAARARLDAAESVCREAEHAAHAARESLQHDAIDLRLPDASEALPAIEQALQRFVESQFGLVQHVQELRRAHAERLRQHERRLDAQAQCREREQSLGALRIEAEEAQARFEVLRDAVSAQVESLRRQLADARETVRTADLRYRETGEAWRAAGEARASASTTAASADVGLAERSDARAAAVTRLQRFAESSLLSSALPELELPDLRSAWTIDPALSLARRIEQLLADVADDDASWNTMQQRTGEELQELQRALSALGHQAPAEPTNWGLVVHIVFHNRPERPDRLAARLADEVAQRSELLTASERAVLENHLQAEIATEVQRLLRAAEKQVEAINRELHKRPTTTGVRYRLRWQPLGENEGAPVGLEIARTKLLNTSADLWSAQDRRVVGHMLQQRIAAERERADADLDRNERGTSLIDQLARALDYRRWHRFRVERQQAGQWRKLSGPASSGERALGLTVPLFAAVASFYGQGASPHAPRLMLLDEAFAGIDDAARAHCMGLIHEFDLDFVLTSEREWGCYAELPGVSICQLQRREGIDAVFVSRWTWDGKARRREADPDRRFAPAS